MGYESKLHLRHCMPEMDFGQGSAETFSFRLPTGYQAQLKKIGVSITETFACNSTAAHVQLGISGDNDAYAKLVIADAAADNDCWDETDDTDAILEDNIAADTLLRVTLTNGTDATAVAGKGRPFFDFLIWQ